MKNLFFPLSILILTSGCFTIGKVGYLVPAPHDNSEVTEGIFGQECPFIVTNIINDMNKDLLKRKNSDLSNVGLQFTGANCAQVRGLK
ncbi:hypothetical protein [Leptospira kmetyi]|uniref:hypothetical protein n=1 Tax=Leptospira kmetyi TaxID=408139 RepID=UPI003EBF74E1